MLRQKNKVPQYIQDLENGRFAEVVEDDGESIFAYYIDPTIGRASAGIGSIATERDDPFIQFLSDELCVKMFMRLREVRKAREKAKA